MKQCKVRKGKITPTQPPPFPPSLNKQKERKHLGKNNQNESNRIDQKPETKKDGTYQFSRFYFTCMYPYTKRSIYLSRAVSRTHARTTPKSENKRQRPSIHPSIHPFFLDYITQKGIPPRHKRKPRARNSRLANQSEREREIYSFCLGHITEYDFISPQHASYQHTVLDADAADENDDDDDGYPTNYIAPHPTRSSYPFIHSTERYVTSW